MRLHEIKKPRTQKKAKRVGRGGKRGTYSGRGMKGQKSRAGAKIRPAIRDFIKKFPKLRGAEGRGRTRPQVVPPASLDIAEVARAFRAGEKVTPRTLLEKGLIYKRLGKLPSVKLLGSGNVGKKLLVAECQISKNARAALEKAGGTVQ